MSALDPASDRAVAARLEQVTAVIDPLLRTHPPADWAPGLRRPAVASDLIRALAGGWPTNDAVDTDPWSVPNGYPDGAEAWPTREAAGGWLGVDRVAALDDLVPSWAVTGTFDVDRTGRTGGDTPLAEHLATGASGHPIALRARHWPHPDDEHPPPGQQWLELVGISRHLGPDGPRSLLLINATWRIHDRRYVEAHTHPGRDGFLLVTPTGSLDDSGQPHVDALGAFVHLLTGPIPRTALDVLTHRWRARLLATYRARIARGADPNRPEPATAPPPTSSPTSSPASSPGSSPASAFQSTWPAHTSATVPTPQGPE